MLGCSGTNNTSITIGLSLRRDVHDDEKPLCDGLSATQEERCHQSVSEVLHDIKIECGLDVRVLRSDNGGEYRNAEMTRFCRQKMIKQEFTVPYNPEQNGMAERLNRTLVEMTRCMLIESKMDKTYWCEAMMTAVDICNVLPSASSSISSPFDMVFKRKPRTDLL